MFCIFMFFYTVKPCLKTEIIDKIENFKQAVMI